MCWCSYYFQRRFIIFVFVAASSAFSIVTSTTKIGHDKSHGLLLERSFMKSNYFRNLFTSTTTKKKTTTTTTTTPATKTKQPIIKPMAKNKKLNFTQYSLEFDHCMIGSVWDEDMDEMDKFYFPKMLAFFPQYAFFTMKRNVSSFFNEYEEIKNVTEWDGDDIENNGDVYLGADLLIYLNATVHFYYDRGYIKELPNLNCRPVSLPQIVEPNGESKTIPGTEKANTEDENDDYTAFAAKEEDTKAAEDAREYYVGPICSPNTRLQIVMGLYVDERCSVPASEAVPPTKYHVEDFMIGQQGDDIQHSWDILKTIYSLYKNPDEAISCKSASVLAPNSVGGVGMNLVKAGNETEEEVEEKEEEEEKEDEEEVENGGNRRRMTVATNKASSSSTAAPSVESTQHTSKNSTTKRSSNNSTTSMGLCQRLYKLAEFSGEVENDVEWEEYVEEQFEGDGTYVDDFTWYEYDDDYDNNNDEGVEWNDDDSGESDDDANNNANVNNNQDDEISHYTEEPNDWYFPIAMDTKCPPGRGALKLVAYQGSSCSLAANKDWTLTLSLGGEEEKQWFGDANDGETVVDGSIAWAEWQSLTLGDTYTDSDYYDADTPDNPYKYLRHWSKAEFAYVECIHLTKTCMKLRIPKGTCTENFRIFFGKSERVVFASEGLWDEDGLATQIDPSGIYRVTAESDLIVNFGYDEEHHTLAWNQCDVKPAWETVLGDFTAEMVGADDDENGTDGDDGKVSKHVIRATFMMFLMGGMMFFLMKKSRDRSVLIPTSNPDGPSIGGGPNELMLYEEAASGGAGGAAAGGSNGAAGGAQRMYSGMTDPKEVGMLRNQVEEQRGTIAELERKLRELEGKPSDRGLV